MKVIFLSKSIFSLSCFTMLFLNIGCKKFIEVGPPENSIGQENVYLDDLTATAVLTDIYTQLQSGTTASGAGPFVSIPRFTGASADELNVVSGNTILDLYYTNALRSVKSGISAGVEFWNEFYRLLYPCNAAIYGINTSGKLTPKVKQQLLGEAKFLRALLLFNLVNLYGDIPLVKDIDPNINASLSRVPAKEVYTFVITELVEAEILLSVNFLNGNLSEYTSSTVPDRARPTKWAAQALLARAYLYNEEYAKAEVTSNNLINTTTLFRITTLDSVFRRDSKEAIWQLQPVDVGRNTRDGEFFNLSVSPEGLSSLNKPFSISPFLLNAFESGDKRRAEWIGTYTSGGTTTYYPYKYKRGLDAAVTTLSAVTEYTMVLRMSEQYLIRAEAKAMQGKYQEAINDINYIRLKHGGFVTPLSVPANRDAAMAIILHERQVELFTEGHRWFDLKRTGTVDAVMSTVTSQKGGTWDLKGKLYPIPYSDIELNPNLIQTAGYE